MNDKLATKIEIKPTGSYFKVDEDGYIINPTSLEKIQAEWKPVINDILGVYKKVYGDALKQVYLRGSVAKGEAVMGVSDIDTFAFIDLPSDYLKEKPPHKEMQKLLTEKYDFIENIEMRAYSILDSSNTYILLNQSLCIYGDMIQVQKMKPGKEMAVNAPFFHKRFLWVEKFLAREGEPDIEVEKVCVRVMKGLVRVGFEITMERSQRYTRDLYKCYETFSEYYPEKETQMREVLDLSLNPTSDKKIIKKIMDNFGKWLLLETPKYFEMKN